MASSSRKTSPIWSFFCVAEDTKYAVCNDGKQKLSRGGTTTKTFNTSNLVSHLKSKHVEALKEFERLKAADSQEKQVKVKSKLKQQTLEESKDRAKVWDVNDPRAQLVHRRIAEMIALDYQPFSTVEDDGFNRLLRTLEPRYSVPSRRYITETIMPQLKEEVTDKLKVELVCVEYFSFTTDIWSTDVSHDSLLSLTAHWLTDSFVNKSAVLHAQSFPGSHTGENIARTYEAMFDEWSIKTFSS